jgi:hypothetical protein
MRMAPQRTSQEALTSTVVKPYQRCILNGVRWSQISDVAKGLKAMTEKNARSADGSTLTPVP